MNSVSLAQMYGPAWAVRARNTGGSRRPVNKRHRTAERLGGSSRTMRRLASIPRPGVKQIGFTGGSPARGWRSIPSCSAGGRGAIGWMEGGFVFGLCIGVGSNGRGASMSKHGMSQKAIDSVEQALLAAPGGSRAVAIAKKLTYSARSVQNCLSDLASRGLAVSVKATQHENEWFHADFVGRRDALAAELLANRMERKRTHNLARKAQRRGGDNKQDGDFERAPIQVCVKAHLAIPIRPAGPSSVWGLAA